MSSSNDVSYETFKNNKKKMNVVMYAVIGLIIIAIGGMVATTGGSGPAIAGLLVFAAGAYSIYYGYEILIDPRNERRANLDYFNQQSCVTIPAEYLKDGADIDIVLDSMDTALLIKAEYEGYGGVYLKSNTSQFSVGGTFDGFFIPKDTKVHKVVRASGSSGADNYACFLFTVKKGDKAVVLRDVSGARIDTNYKCSPAVPLTCKASIATENA